MTRRADSARRAKYDPPPAPPTRSGSPHGERCQCIGCRAARARPKKEKAP